MDALGPDNEGYVETELRGDKLVFRTGSESAGTLRNTADDLMACIKTAEGAVLAGSSGGRSRSPFRYRSMPSSGTSTWMYHPCWLCIQHIKHTPPRTAGYL